MKARTRLLILPLALLGVILTGRPKVSGLSMPVPDPSTSAAMRAPSESGKVNILRMSGKLRVLTLEGTPYEMGLAHGSALKKEIREIVGLWKKDLETAYGTDASSFIKALLARTNFRPSIDKWTPGLLDEVRGIADGAGLDFDTMYAYQLIDETWVAGPDLVTAKCTSIGAQKTADHPAFVSQTLDIPGFYHGYQTVLRIRERGTDLDALVLTIPGVVAANGLNSRGVGVCVNAVTQLAYTTDGLPVAFIIRGILKKRSFGEASEFLRAIKPAAPQNYVLGGPDGMASFELAGNRIAPFVPFVGAALTYHTNHPMVNENFNPKFLELMKARGGSLERLKGSCPRFNFLRKMLGDNSAALGLEELKSLYRDRKSGVNNAETYACTIMLLGDDPELHIAPGRPDKEPFQVLAFSSRPRGPAPRPRLPD
jgi:isopenicillin-N N-acyltransferase-like protein